MSAVTAMPDLATRPPRILLPLARSETRRVLLHPVSLLGWLLFAVVAVFNTVGDHGPRSAYESVDTLMSFYPGIMLVLVGNLVASRDRRAGSDELLAAVPVRPDRRTGALLLAAPAVGAVGLGAILVQHAVNLGLGRYEVAPGPWQVIQGPVTLAGAVLLGVLVARWLRSRIAIVLVIAVLVAANVWLNAQPNGQYFGPMMGWARWGVMQESWGGLFEGSPGWRVGYLVGLCSLAALAAALPVVRSRRPVVIGGLVALAVTAACGWLQLP